MPLHHAAAALAVDAETPRSGWDAASAQAPEATPPGWHVDPLDDALLRYWDGQHWTGATQPAQVPPPPAGWTRVVDVDWWQQPTDVSPTHDAAWHLLAQHAREHDAHTAHGHHAHRH